MIFLKTICLAVLLFSIYCLVIALIQTAKHLDTVNARKYLFSFIKDCISFFDKPAICFPVTLGIDENGAPHGDVIENEFDALHKIFDNFYFVDCLWNDTYIQYRVHVDTMIKEMSEKDLLVYLEHMFDTVFQRYIHKNCPNHKAVPNLVAVHLQEGILDVFVARNENGTKMIHEHKQQERAFYNESHKQDASIDESWDEE